MCPRPRVVLGDGDRFPLLGDRWPRARPRAPDPRFPHSLAGGDRPLLPPRAREALALCQKIRRHHGRRRSSPRSRGRHLRRLPLPGHQLRRTRSRPRWRAVPDLLGRRPHRRRRPPEDRRPRERPRPHLPGPWRCRRRPGPARVRGRMGLGLGGQRRSPASPPPSLRRCCPPRPPRATGLAKTGTLATAARPTPGKALPRCRPWRPRTCGRRRRATARRGRARTAASGRACVGSR